MASAVVAAVVVVPITVASAADTLLSQGKPATSSSVQGADLAAANAVDGNTATRWGSQWSDPQWLQVDLGQSATINSVTLRWEAAYGTAFTIQTSPDGTAWTNIYATTTATGGIQDLSITPAGTGRYVLAATQSGHEASLAVGMVCG